jgi:hypothetical protein
MRFASFALKLELVIDLFCGVTSYLRYFHNDALRVSQAYPTGAALIPPAVKAAERRRRYRTVCAQ